MLCSVAASAVKTQPRNPPVTFPRLISHENGRRFVVTAANGGVEAQNYEFANLISKFNNIINVNCKAPRQRAAAVVVRFVEGSVRRTAIRTAPLERRRVLDRGVRLGLGRELERAQSAVRLCPASCRQIFPANAFERSLL
jgi:hypothetical protein